MAIIEINPIINIEIIVIVEIRIATITTITTTIFILDKERV